MKVVGIQSTNLDECVVAAQNDRVVVTRDGVPLVLVVDVSGMDMEQIELSQSEKFWKLIEERRQGTPITREELERRLAERDAELGCE